jgi:hypothetical protein
VIARNLNKNVRIFAYPFGLHDPRSSEMAQRAGYTYAFTSDSGFLEHSPSLFLLKRTNVGMRPPLVVCAMVEGWGDWISSLVKALKWHGSRAHA